MRKLLFLCAFIVGCASHTQEVNEPGTRVVDTRQHDILCAYAIEVNSGGELHLMPDGTFVDAWDDHPIDVNVDTACNDILVRYTERVQKRQSTRHHR